LTTKIIDMDLQRLIELDNTLDKVIQMRGQRLAEELEFANTPESTRSVARDVGMAGAGASVAGAGMLAARLLSRGKVKGKMTPRQERSAYNKKKHASDQRRQKNKRKFDRATLQAGSRKDNPMRSLDLS
jgi:hypothetical protein